MEIFKVVCFHWKICMPNVNCQRKVTCKICWLGNSWKTHSENNLTSVSVLCKLFKVWVKKLKIYFQGGINERTVLLYWKIQFRLSILSKYVFAATQKTPIRNHASEFCAKMKYQSIPGSTYSCSHVSLRKMMIFFPQKLLPQ